MPALAVMSVKVTADCARAAGATHSIQVTPHNPAIAPIGESRGVMAVTAAEAR